MRVLHFLQSNHFSGAENVVCQIFDMLKSESDIEMAYCSRDGQIREALEGRGIVFFPIKKLSVAEVKRVIRAFNPDIIHAHDITASILAVFASDRRKCKIISHVHVNNSNMAHINKKTILYGMIVTRLSYIFWVSHSCYDSYVFRKMVENKSEVLNNVVDKISILSKCKKDPNEYHYDVVFIGRITEQKDPDRLLAVLKELVEKLPDVKIAIAGTGNLEMHSKELAAQYGLLSSVDFLGFMQNPLKLLFNAKVMVMTSKFEGLPMTVLEAMALGTPVVSTPVDGLVDIISNGVNGYLESENSLLVQRLIEIVKNPSLQNVLSQNCVQVFNKMNDLERYKDRILRAYAQV